MSLLWQHYTISNGPIRRRALRITAGCVAALFQFGCAQWNYDNIRVGQELRDQARALPEARSRRTEAGLCFLDRDMLGKSDAIVVLLTRDQRVYGKLHASYERRNLGFRVESHYQLAGVLDPEVGQFHAVGPVDTVRAVLDELTDDITDALTQEAHGLVAAGLMRLLQRWPHIGEEGLAYPQLNDMLERVPAGGRAGIAVNEEGMYVLEYIRQVEW